MEKNPTLWNWQSSEKIYIYKFPLCNEWHLYIYIYIYIYKFSEGHAFEKARLIGLEVCRKQGMIQNLSR